jgi:hypothetical protein
LLWIAVGAATVGLHPALRDGTPLHSLAQQIAADEKMREGFAQYFMPTLGTDLATWGLVLSLFYMAGWGLFALNPSTAPASPIPPALGLAVILGYAGTMLARDALIFTILAAGIPALSLPFLRWPPAPEIAPSRRRLVSTCALGSLLVLLGAVIDSQLASIKDAPLLPEAWFAIAAESPGRAAAASVAVLGACAALALPRAGAPSIAPACVLVLLPSSTFKGVAVGLVVGLMSRSGAGPGWRFGFIVAILALHVVAAVRL